MSTPTRIRVDLVAESPRRSLLARSRSHAIRLSEDYSAQPHPSTYGWRAYLPFAAVLVLYVALQLLVNGRLLLSGAMWAELGLNYTPTTTKPLIEQLVTNDAGYLPLPQRILALPLGLLHVPAAVHPYFYSAVALIGTGLLVGTLCLPIFRSLIISDAARGVIAAGILVVPDFNTRLFTNFTYFAIVPLLAVTALALVDRSAVPAWAWALPLFFVSKLPLHAVLPAMVLVAVLRRGRFRRMTIASIAAAVLQYVYISVTSPTLLTGNGGGDGFNGLPRALVFAVGFLGRWTTDVVSPPSVKLLLVSGALVSASLLAVVVLVRGPSAVLVAVALATALIAVALSSGTIDWRNTGPATLVQPIPFARDRLHITAIIAIMMAIGATCSAVVSAWFRGAERRARLHGGAGRPSAIGAIAVLLFAAWFAASGWAERSTEALRTPGVPTTGISQWQRLARTIDGSGPVCVPVDGGWVYGRDCTALVGTVIPEPDAVRLDGFQPLLRSTDGGWTIDMAVPEAVTEGGLRSLAVLVRPADEVDGPMTARAALTSRSGRREFWSATSTVRGNGGLLQLSAPAFHDRRGVRQVQLRFNRPVEIAVASAYWTRPHVPYVMWLGVPGRGAG